MVTNLSFTSSKLVYLNNQMSEENQKLVRELNERPQVVIQKTVEPVSKPQATASTQTSEQPERSHGHVVRTEDDYEVSDQRRGRPLLHAHAAVYSLNRNPSYVAGQSYTNGQHQHPASNYANSDNFKMDKASRSGHVNTASPATSSSSKVSRNPSNNATVSNNLSRNDDYLINNFRPFSNYSTSDQLTSSTSKHSTVPSRHYNSPIYTNEGGRYSKDISSVMATTASPDSYDPAQLRLKSAMINSSVKGALRNSYVSEEQYRRTYYEDSSARKYDYKRPGGKLKDF